MTEATRPPIEKALEGWKEIAAYLQREVRTAKRWEKSEGLPVHRHLHQSKSSVYAYASELEAWRAARLPVATGRRWARMWRVAAVSMSALLLMASFRSGPIASAATESGTGISLSQVMTHIKD